MYKTFIKPFSKDVKTFVLDTIFPIRCLVCEKEGSFICTDCLALLARLDYQHCIICQKPSISGFTHPGCLTPHTADGLISVLNYRDENVAEIVIKGKYHFLPGTFEVLGNLLAKKIEADYSFLFNHDNNQKPILIPLPLHPRRKRWRGFNQAEILCHTLSKELNLGMLDALTRNKVTKTQKDLKKDQRIKNVANAFSLKKDADVHNQNLILVDDVTTTGSTLLEAAKVLKRNGAKSVWCLTIARD